MVFKFLYFLPNIFRVLKEQETSKNEQSNAIFLADSEPEDFIHVEDSIEDLAESIDVKPEIVHYPFE